MDYWYHVGWTRNYVSLISSIILLLSGRYSVELVLESSTIAEYNCFKKSVQQSFEEQNFRSSPSCLHLGAVSCLSSPGKEGGISISKNQLPIPRSLFHQISVICDVYGVYVYL